ncbi:hypothetical protein HDU76_009188, partial [Blyttiomyces sp. JEL0837]
MDSNNKEQQSTIVDMPSTTQTATTADETTATSTISANSTPAALPAELHPALSSISTTGTAFLTSASPSGGNLTTLTSTIPTTTTTTNKDVKGTVDTVDKVALADEAAAVLEKVRRSIENNADKRSIRSGRSGRSARSRRTNGSDDGSIRSGKSFDSHLEPHFAGAEVVRDVIVGLSDGLTVPFALAAGLSSLNNSRIVVTAGMAEIVAGAISMGLGGYLAGRSEIEHYEAERKREFEEISEVPHREEAEIIDIFRPYGLDREGVEPLLRLLRADPEKWVEFMMKFELSLERPDNSRSWISAITIGFS